MIFNMAAHKFVFNNSVQIVINAIAHSVSGIQCSQNAFSCYLLFLLFCSTKLST